MFHLEVLLTLLSFIGIASLVTRLCGQSFVLSFLYAQLATLFALYAGGLAHQLDFAAGLVRLLGLVSFAVIGLPAFVNAPSAIKRPANIYLLVTLAGFYLQTLTANYHDFAQIDDYSHWGKMSRIISSNDRFVVFSDSIGVKDYPPGLAIIHYFYSNFAGYSDALALYAQGVFVFTCLAILFQPLDGKGEKFRSMGFLLLALASLSLTWIFFFGLHTLWADLPLGLLFGVVLWMYFLDDGPEVGRILRVAPIILCMPLIKQMGLVFVLIAALIVAIDLCSARSKNVVSGLLLVAAAVLVAGVIDLTWKAYLSSQEIQRTFQSNLSIVEVGRAFIPAYSSLRQKATIEAFINHFLGRTHFTTYWILLSVAAAIAAYKSSADEKKYVVGVRIAGAFIGLLLYLVLLLILYMFSFSEFEGTRVASINRYTNTYLLGLLIGFGGVFAANACSESFSKYKRIWVGVVAFFFIAPNFGRTVNDVARSIVGSEAPYLAPKIRAQADRVIGLTPADAKIYFLWAGGSNDESVIFNYSIHPRTSNTVCSNIRPQVAKIDDSEPNICWLAPQEIEARIAEFDYIFIGNISGELQSSVLGPIGLNNAASGDLYSIKRAAGSVRLEKVYPK